MNLQEADPTKFRLQKAQVGAGSFTPFLSTVKNNLDI
jgi:hypothetical protein